MRYSLPIIIAILAVVIYLSPHQHHHVYSTVYSTSPPQNTTPLLQPYERVNSSIIEDVIQFYRSKNLTTQCGKIEVYLRPDLRGYVGIAEGCTIYIKRVEPYVIAHEIAHLFIPFRGDWRQESVADGIALAYLHAKGYDVPRRNVDVYFTKRLYERSPFDAKEEEWYDYAAPFAWVAQNTTDWRWAYQPEAVYLRFLEALKDCVTIFGVKYCPEYTEVRNAYNESFKMAPYTARYFRIKTSGDFVIVSDGFIERIYPPSVTIAYIDTIGKIRRIEISYVYIHATAFVAKINDVYVTVVYLEESKNGRPYKPVNGIRDINDTSMMFTNGIAILKTWERPQAVTIYNKTVEVRLAEHISAEKDKICVS